MAPASFGDVGNKTRGRPSLSVKNGEVALARRRDGASLDLRRWC